MKNKKPQRINPKLAFHLHRWHRRFGVISALFLMLVSVTGLLLQHPEMFKLTQQNVSSSWLLNYYGIAPSKLGRTYQSGTTYFSQVDQRVYANEQFVSDIKGELIGVHQLESFIVIASNYQITLTTLELEKIDTFGYPPSIELPVRNLSKDKSPLVFHAKNGLFSPDETFEHFKSIQFIRSPNWQETSTLPEAVKEHIIADARQQNLNYERVTLDLHSGRLLGTFGPLIMDFMAILFFILAVSGIWLWSRKKRW